MTVTCIEPIGGGTGSDDASITLRCGATEITVFSFGRIVTVGDTVQEALSALDCEIRAAYLVDWPEDVKNELAQDRIEKTALPYGYRGCGRVVDQENGVIEVFGFLIYVGDLDFVWPGAVVEFECLRLDL